MAFPRVAHCFCLSEAQGLVVASRSSLCFQDVLETAPGDLRVQEACCLGPVERWAAQQLKGLSGYSGPHGRSGGHRPKPTYFILSLGETEIKGGNPVGSPVVEALVPNRS